MEGMRISCVLSVDRSRAATGPASGCIPLQRPRPHACRPDRTLADKNQPARPASIASADAEHVAVVAIDVELHRASIAGLALDLVEAVLPLDLAQVAVAQDFHALEDFADAQPRPLEGAAHGGHRGGHGLAGLYGHGRPARGGC